MHNASASAVIAFHPVSTGVPGTELSPIYVLTVIVLCVLGMTLVLTLYQRWHPASGNAESVSEIFCVVKKSRWTIFLSDSPSYVAD